MEHSAYLRPFARPTDGDLIRIVRGEGARVFDAEGTPYIDAMAGLWYCNIGHGRPDMAEAIADQLATLENFHSFDRFTNPVAEALAERIAGLAPMADTRIFFTTSGSEAVESALKLARQAHARAGRPERTMFVGRHHSYHGVAYGGLSAQGLPANQEGFGPFLGDVARIAHDSLASAEAVFAEHGERIAAVLAEPVMGAGGVRPAPAGYLEGLRRLCDEHGAFLIFDEVICAFGRLGRWFGAEHVGVRPDLITFAKAVTSGYLPLGGVVVGPAVRQPLESDPSFVLRHGHTYSGHPTSCVAGLTNIDIIEKDDLLARAPEIAERLGAALARIVEDGLAAEVRGVGGMWALDMLEGVSAEAVRDACFDRGVLPRSLGETLVFCPPLVIEDADLDRTAEVTAEVLAESAR